MYRNYLLLALLLWPTVPYRNVHSMNNHSKPSSTVVTPVSLRVERNARIRAEFQQQYERGQRVNFILAELSKRYYLAEDTLERIVFERGHYKPTATSGTALASGARPVA